MPSYRLHIIVGIFFLISSPRFSTVAQVHIGQQTDVPILKGSNEYAIIHKNLGRPSVHNHTPREYNSTAQNWAVAQDDRGIMYFGNNRGVLEYDGSSWRLIQVGNQSLVRALAKGPKGRIFVGAVGEFGYLQPDSSGNLKYATLIDKLDDDIGHFEDIWSIHVDGNDVYFQSKKRLFRLRDDQIQVWHTADSYHRSFFINNKLYLKQTGSGLAILTNDMLETIPQSEFLSEMHLSLMLPLEDHKILIGTRDHGLFLYDSDPRINPVMEQVFYPFNTSYEAFLLKNRIYHGIQLTSTAFALATLQGGVVIMDTSGKIIQHFNQANGLDGNNTLYLFKDQAQSLWVAKGNGISHIEIFSPIGFFGEQDNLKEAVYGIGTHKGTLFTATDAGILFLEDKSGNSPFFRKVSGFNSQGWNLLNFTKPDAHPMSSTRHILLASTNAGVCAISRSRDGYEAQIIHKLPFTFNLHQMQKDPSQLIVAHKEGLVRMRYSKTGWESMGPIEGIHEKILTLAEDNDGNLWMGSNYSGILRIDGSYFQSDDQQDTTLMIKRYDMDDGLPSQNWNHVYFFNNELVVATMNGIYVYDAPTDQFQKHKKISEALDEQNGWVYKMTHDRHGNIWFDSEQGKGGLLFQEDKSYRLLESPLKAIAPSPENEISLYASDDGVVWFGSPTGLIRFKYPHAFPMASNFNTIIRKVHTAEDTVYFNGTFYQNNTGTIIPSLLQPESSIPVMNHTQSSVTFDFTATSYNLETSNQFQYFLEGFDKDWSPWMTEVKKDLTNLPSGQYLFRVRGKNAYGQMGNENSYRFEILTPAYKAWWAIILYAIGIVLFILLCVRWRTTRLESRQRELEKTVAHRTEQLSLKNKELATKNEEISTQAQELLELNDTLNSMNENLELLVRSRTSDLAKKNKTMAEYTFRMAHQLRAPVADILGLLHLFDLELDANDQKEVLANLKQVSAQLDQEVIEITRKMESDNKAIQNNPPENNGL